MDGNGSTIERTYTVGFPFGGIGLGALGFLDAESRLFGSSARFRSLGSLDLDAQACALFERFTKSPALVCDIAKLTPDELRAFWPTAPDVIFTSPPCKGYSKLTSKKARLSKKYQDMNRLALDWVRLMLATWPDAPPRLMLLENVPGIATLGADLLREIRKLLRAAGYVVSPNQTHDCGELGGLAQHRERFLMVARHAARVPALLYQPRKLPLRTVGEVLSRLPLPGDPAAGPLHALPKISTLNWMRLAAIPPGGDWRDIPGTVVEGKKRREVFRRYHTCAWSGVSPTIASGGTNAPNYVADVRVPTARYGMNMRVAAWGASSWCVTGATDVQAGAPSVADLRIEADNPNRHTSKYRVTAWDGTAHTITGTDARIGSGAPTVADVRVKAAFRESYGVLSLSDIAGTIKGNSWVTTGRFSIADVRVSTAYDAGYGVLSWDGTARTIAGMSFVGCGAYALADIRLTCVARNGAYGVASWYAPTDTVTGSAQIDNGPVCVADPRVPGNPELALRWYPHSKHLRRPAPFPLVIATDDGSWHRPMTTLDLMLLMDGPVEVDGEPLAKWASDAKMREHIGNGVPVGTARAIAGQILNTLVAGDMECGIMFGGGGAVWVREREALSAEGTALQ